ncbi:IS5 family transposase [Deinococcus yavapaiensis]|uniref:Transposase n=1 Tax=Deinococcus yavapaiensis KR-236 TaxID=694435 RepID=A0A318S7I6_9DEIO|nr:IS5 family transposase [Deinococcus yavapaiensis]PYE50991.1 transposase [Deinococcus yavapaiensis KR-236]
MLDQLVPDDLWRVVNPIIPRRVQQNRPGRKRIYPRRTLAGILDILRWGLPWRSLPLALGFGSGRTCERRFHAWCQAGVWQRLFRLVLDHAEQHGLLDWSRASLDSASVPAPRGGQDVGPNPTDRGKNGSKIHLLVDGHGLPLGVTISGANVHDNQRFEQTLDAVQGVRNGRQGRPRRRPDKLHADKGYDARRCRHACRTRGIKARIARRGKDSSERLGRWRWRVERTLAWVLAFRKLAVRRERSSAAFLGLCQLACMIIVWRRVSALSGPAAR